jgi:hypothetical protein
LDPKPWHIAALEEICRTLPRKVVAARNKTEAERREFLAVQMSKFRKLLEEILELK